MCRLGLLYCIFRLLFGVSSDVVKFCYGCKPWGIGLSDFKVRFQTKVDLDTGHIVLDGFPAIGERGTAALLFSAHTYCGHSRSSQLLLSSCRTYKRPASADRTARRQFQATGQPVSRTQADAMTSRLPRYEAKCVQRRCFQCGSVRLRSDIKGTELHLPIY